METILIHYLIRGTDGTSTMCEVSYAISRHREGVLRYMKIPGSERPCTCSERDGVRRLAGVPE